ncbi:MAG: glycosyltransferase family 2 protein [Ignavibacteriales bacterium]|nr:glycosyltransferase family 2 protein [Ignavibacteriales bacterium]
MLIPDKISAYINKRTSDIWEIQNDHRKYFQKIIVVPSIAESKSLPTLINSLEQNDGLELLNTLLLIVVNNSISSSEEVKIDNQVTLDYLRDIKTSLNISFIDACSNGKELDDKNGGVGLARKIGMDLALTKFDYLSINKKILICTDADCIVDLNYLSEISQEFNRNNYEAAVVNFAHDINGDDEETKAIVCYEIFLRYYVLGLNFAKSDYAFHTIGSTMLCTPEAYVKVEGMNKRKAAEDFYFLEKLAKIYPIGEIKSTYVYPSKRGSWRVPFGTGRSVDRYLLNERDEYQLYNPKSFIILKNWLEVFYDRSLSQPELVSGSLNIAKNIHPSLYEFLIQQNFQNFINKVLIKGTNPNEIEKQKHFWFDAFRTLKLIHYLRDETYPNINMFDAIDELLKMMSIENMIKRNSAIPELEIQKEYLLLLRKIQS